MPHFPESSDYDATMLRASTTTGMELDETAARTDRIRVKNRRKRYLDLHPEYFNEPHLELAGR